MPPTTTLNFQSQPITVKATVVKEAVPTARIGIDATPGGKLSAPTSKPYTGGPRVSVVDSVPANLKSAAPLSFGQKVAAGAVKVGAKIASVGLGVALDLVTDLIFPEPVGLGSDMVGGRPINNTKPATTAPQTKPKSRPQTQTQTRPQAQTQPQVKSPTVGREDPFAPIVDFAEPFSPVSIPITSTPVPTPAPAPFKPKPVPQPEARKAIDFDAKAGTGSIILAPIKPQTQTLTTPSTLDSVDTGGVNLLTPIVGFLKKLDLDIQQIKLSLQDFQLDFSPVLEGISRMIDPIMEAIAFIPETYSQITTPILEGLVELLTPIASLTATSIEVSSKNPRTTTETVAEFVAPIFLLITLLGTALDGIGKAISGLTLKTGIQIPQGMAVAAQIPMGMAATAQIPMGMAAAAQIPMGMAAAAQIPMGMAATAQIPQSQTVLADLPQNIVATADLSILEVELQALQKNLEDLAKCCKDVQDKLKKKKKDDDDRFPEFKSDGLIECDGATIPYSYAGEGLKGLHQQQNIILGISKMMLKKVCDNDTSSFSFPDIFGGGTYLCDGKIFNYEYSGPGLIGLSNQIGELTKVNTKILAEVCEEEDIFGQIDFFDCEGNTQVLLYNGDGSLGLSSQINALTHITKLTYAKACETPSCIPVQPADEFAEFDVPRQLVLTWGENYPTQVGSLWHTPIPNPREDLDWCRDFDNLIFTKGNVYGRWQWENSKIRSGMRCEDEAEADRILDLIANLTTATGKKRFTKGGGVKLDPAVRSVRCVRAAIAQLNAEGLAEVVQCFVPPAGGC